MTDRENFYLLLELPLNPPEENLEVIEAAIKEKQNEWSRYRNHPTKAIMAQQYIGMIPDIRSVMTDEKLRKKEAKRALKIIEAKEKKKARQLDHHLTVLMSKGNISKKEIKALAALHEVEDREIRAHLKRRDKPLRINQRIERMVARGKTDEKTVTALSKSFGVDPDKIRERLKKKEAEKEEELSQYLERCLTRGYTSNDEIDVVAKGFGMKPDEVLHRVKCPVKKNHPEQTAPVETLDKTIEKIIQEKLKIVGKKSLYDFLELPSNSDIDTLKKRASEKEGYIRRISNKDATATASGALAGHCIAIFKNEKSRRAYDTSLTLSRIGELDAELDVSALGGSLSPEGYQRAMRLALRLGMEALEADAYIRDYCKKKGWKIQTWAVDPDVKRYGIMAAAGIFGLILLLYFGGVAMSQYREMRLKNEWQDTLAKVERQTSLEGKEVILSNFVRYSEESEYKQEAERRIRDIKQQIHDRDFETLVKRAEAKAAEKDFAGARNLLNQFITNHPRTPHADDVKLKLNELTALADDAAFETLKALPEGATMEERIIAYESYLSRYPEGRHVEEVREMRTTMIDGYFNRLEADLQSCEATGDWAACIALSDAFIERFKFTEKAKVAEGFKVKYQNRIQRDRDVAKLREEADAKGQDLEGARQVFIDYIEANPEMPAYMKEKLVAEIQRLDAQIAARGRMEETWTETEQYVQQRGPSVDNKIGRVSGFLRNYPQSPYDADARRMLERLNDEKEREEKRLAAEREEQAWNETSAYAKDNRVSYDNRIARLQSFINDYPNSRRKDNAADLLERLRAQKQREEERQRALQANRARIQQEMNRIRAAIQGSGGRFRDNGNGTVTDTRTGRMWAMVDGYFHTGRCLTYQGAVEYAGGLTTGGYSDWRVPTVDELDALLGESPAFPANTSTWYWSANTLWHGWNKMANIFTPAGGRWTRKETPVSECGSVLAVR